MKYKSKTPVKKEKVSRINEPLIFVILILIVLIIGYFISGS